MDIFPEKPKASRLSPGSPQFPLIPRARWSRKVKSPALQNRGQGTQIRLTPLRPGHPSCNLRVIQAQIQPPHQIPNRTYAVLFLYQLLHIYCSQQHLPPIYRYQPWNTVLCSLHARSLHTSIPSAASISSHVPVPGSNFVLALPSRSFTYSHIFSLNVACGNEHIASEELARGHGKSCRRMDKARTQPSTLRGISG